MLAYIRLLLAACPVLRATAFLLVASLVLLAWRNVLAQEQQCAALQDDEQAGHGILIGDFESKLPARFAEGSRPGERGIDS